jgi:hypothetical protein
MAAGLPRFGMDLLDRLLKSEHSSRLSNPNDAIQPQRTQSTQGNQVWFKDFPVHGTGGTPDTSVSGVPTRS